MTRSRFLITNKKDRQNKSKTKFRILESNKLKINILYQLFTKKRSREGEEEGEEGEGEGEEEGEREGEKKENKIDILSTQNMKKLINKLCKCSILFDFLKKSQIRSPESSENVIISDRMCTSFELKPFVSCQKVKIFRKMMY